MDLEINNFIKFNMLQSVFENGIFHVINDRVFILTKHALDFKNSLKY